MNIIDIIVVVLIALYGISGLYRGFVPAVMNLISFFMSWIAAFLFHPLLSRALVGTELMQSMHIYIEGAERIADFEMIRVPVSDFSPEQVVKIVSDAKLPPPFDIALTDAITNKTLEASGAVTLGDYFDIGVYNVIVNIFSILILFVLLRVLFTLLTNSAAFSLPLMQLRRFDYGLAGAVGALRGFFSMYMLFALVPIGLFVIPAQFFTNVINTSAASGIFYGGSIILPFIRAVI